jgi:glutamine synthetase
LIRIPAKRGNSTRIELRNPDPSANPYLALAAVLKAGLDGMKKDVEPPAPVVSNVYKMDEYEMKEKGIDSLPENLYEAVKELTKDEVIKDVLGDHTYKKLKEAAIKEWRDYSTFISAWELDKYLRKF